MARRSRDWAPAAAIAALVALILSASPAAASVVADRSEHRAKASGTAVDSDGDGLTDAFEVRYGLNPHDPDTDHDGLLDPAEDPDRDGLGNKGEQHFHTSPNDADTDGDGVSDWYEDADGDGVPNGAQQDQRHVPPDLKPSLSHARDDVPSGYTDGCHSDVDDPVVHPCLYGDRNGHTEVAIFGDSHAEQWLPALIAIGNQRHWRIRTVTKSGCPAAGARYAPRSGAASDSCRTWRKHAIAWLDAHPADLIVVSNFRGYPMVGGDGRLLSAPDRERAWRKALTTLLDALPTASRRMVLGDTPRMAFDPVTCLKEHPADIAACETSRFDALNVPHADAERAAARAAGATFRSLGAQVCSYDPCPVIVGRYLIWREESHITATYSRKLAPSLMRLLEAALR